MITAVEVAGRVADPALVPAQITILHGRRSTGDSPEASSATLYVITESGMPGWELGDILTLTGDTGVMFTGRITDRGMTHGRRPDGSTYGLFAVTASGPVAALGFRYVGDEPWPAESGAARAARILELAETPYVIDGAADAVLLPRDVDSRPARALLNDVVLSTGAAVVDLPDGRIMYQPMAERARPVRPFRWQDFDPAQTWAEFSPDFTWADFDEMYSGDSEFPLQIPAAAVDWEPTWSQNTEIVNHVRIGYGAIPEGANDQLWTELVDQASVDRFGRRYVYIGTQLKNLADAQAYASWLITVRALPQWRLGDITVRIEALPPELRAQVLALTCGDHVEVHTMPAPTPALVAEGIVEGWTYVMWGQDGHLFEELTLHTSGLLESLAVPTWADHTPDHMWSDYSPLVTWADMTSLEAIGA